MRMFEPVDQPARRAACKQVHDQALIPASQP
jgi:hypothetical protein